jgi:hypothetical protein
LRASDKLLLSKADSSKMGNPKLAKSSESAEIESIPPPYSPATQAVDVTQTRSPNTSHRVTQGGLARPGETVAIDECIIHLKLLSVMANLRNSIRGTDELFGIRNSEAGNFSDPRKQTQAVMRIQEKRWAVYVARAVDRFTDWWQHCLPNLNACRVSALNDLPEAKIAWSANMMPPIG